MPTFEDPVVDADDFREAVRGPTHATRRIEDPSAVYSILGSLNSALASLTQTLHQLGTRPAPARASVHDDRLSL